MKKDRRVEGVFALIATPFGAGAEQPIDFGKLSENLAKFGRTGLAGIVALGSNGEFTMLSHREDIYSLCRRGGASSLERARRIQLDILRLN
jgi:dihydrodipicolinate synthase/N-acetylneuraminate lyase